MRHDDLVCHMKDTNDANENLCSCCKRCIVETTDCIMLERSPMAKKAKK